MATDVKFSQESIERQLHGNGGSSMNKKKIGITFVALVCLAVVVLTARSVGAEKVKARQRKLIS